MDNHEDIKLKIRKINKRLSLSHLEKQQLIQELYYPLDNTIETNLNNTIKKKNIQCINCQHNHTIFADSSNNKINCKKCNSQLNYYKCHICNIISENKDIFHCNKCNICRVGKRNNYIHCDKCNMCIKKDNYDHICIENSLDQNCPICSEYMFDSNKTCDILKCGHTIHSSCLQEYLQSDYRCPICRKTIVDMNIFWKYLKKKVKKDYYFIKKNGYLPIYKIKSYIYCHDCEKKDRTRFHWEYFECNKCKGWNTELLFYR